MDWFKEWAPLILVIMLGGNILFGMFGPKGQFKHDDGIERLMEVVAEKDSIIYRLGSERDSVLYEVKRLKQDRELVDALINVKGGELKKGVDGIHEVLADTVLTDDEIIEYLKTLQDG